MSAKGCTLLSLVAASRGTVIVDDERLTSDDLIEGGRRVARGLAECGIGVDDSVLLTDDATGADLLAGLLGSWWLGARATVVAGSAIAADRSQVATEVGAAVIVAGRPTAGIETVAYADLRSFPPAVVPDRCTPPGAALDIATSGTTGTPRVVSYSHSVLHGNVLAIARRLELGRDDVVYAPLPLSLAGVVGMALMPGLAVDATVHLGRLDGARLAHVHRQLAGTRPTLLYGVPYFFEFLARSRGAAPDSRLRWAICSSAPLPPATFDRVWRYLGVPPRSSYCLAEAGTVTLNTADDIDLLRHAVGEPLDGVEVAVEPEPGQEPGPGAVGRIVVRGESCGLGYRRAGRLEPFPDGVVRTQDRGSMSGGRLTVVGRVDDVIQVAGHNVDLAHVRRVLQDCPGLGSFTVLTGQHPNLGAVPVLVAEADSLSATPNQLLAYCRARLRAPEVPREIRVVDELARTATGKIRIADGQRR